MDASYTLDLPSPSIMCSTSHIHHLAPPFDRGKLRCCSSDAMWVSITWCLCSVEQVYAYPAPAPPESHHGGTAHEAPTNTGHCTYQVIRAPVLKNTFSENLLSQSVCVGRPENQTFQVPVSIQGLFTSAVNPEHFGGSRKWYPPTQLIEYSSAISNILRSAERYFRLTQCLLVDH